MTTKVNGVYAGDGTVLFDYCDKKYKAKLTKGNDWNITRNDSEEDLGIKTFSIYIKNLDAKIKLADLQYRLEALRKELS